MRLLVCTQRVNKNDPILGFFHRWLIEFAEHCDSVEVICLEAGSYDLPRHVRVHSLGKELGAGSRLKYTWRLFRYAFSLRHEYDAVFIHMNPQYVVLLGWFWRLLKKRTLLWYSHRATSLWLRLGVLMADQVFSTTPHAMQIKTPKVQFVGHGIDTEYFSLTVAPANNEWRLVYVGRIAPIKRIELIIETYKHLRAQGQPVGLELIGAADSEQTDYQEKLKAMIPDDLHDHVVWQGSVPHHALASHLAKAQVLINTSPTGGMDKTVLEAMSTGVPVVVTNEAYREVLADFPELVIPDGQVEGLVEATLTAVLLSQSDQNRQKFRAAVTGAMSLSKLVTRIIASLS